MRQEVPASQTCLLVTFPFRNVVQPTPNRRALALKCFTPLIVAMASEGKFDTPTATPDGKPSAQEAAPAASATGVATALTFDASHGEGEVKEADVADGEIMVNEDPRAVAIVKGFGMCVGSCRHLCLSAQGSLGKWNLPRIPPAVST